MKTMTCKQLGGPCDLALTGSTADEVIKAQDKHLRETVAGGDKIHLGALDEMKGRWKHPIAGMGWYRLTKRAFAELPEDSELS
jgi:predicted small metal-binding protein